MVKSKALLQADKCLVMQPALIKVVGKSAALLLQQIHYWIENPKTQGKSHQQKKWISNSYEDWVDDLKIFSRSTVNRSIKTLKNLGILSIEKLSEFKSNRTNWYTINYDRISDVLGMVEVEAPFEKTNQQESISSNESAEDSIKMNRCQVQNEPMYIDKITNKENIIYPSKSKSAKKMDFQNSEKPITQQMLDIWNEIIDPEVKAKLTKERCQQLGAALKLKFNNNLEKWREYCLQIVSSDFLMGRLRNGFKIALDAALKFNFIQKIFEKHFGVKDVQVLTDSKESVLQSIENSPETSEIKDIRFKILERVGHASYVSWFKNTEIKVCSAGLDIIVPSRFIKDWMTNHYQVYLKKLLKRDVTVLLNG